MSHLSYRSSGASGLSADLSADCLIIGSGAGGGMLAHELVLAGRDVLLLEEGPYVGADNAPANLADSFAKLWRGGGLTVALGKTPMAYAEGQCVGGGTEINSAILQRITPELLEAWAKDYQIHDFGADALAPFYTRVETLLNASLTVGETSPPTQLMRDAAAKLGWQGTALMRAQKNCVGTNFCSIACPTGGKQSVTNALLPRALANGLRLIADCRVQKLQIKNGRVTGVIARAIGASGQAHWLNIKARDVFICAGATQTPTLLLRSGIKSQVGQSLRFHPTLKMQGFFKTAINAASNRLPLFAITEFMPDLRLGGSITLPATFGLSLSENGAAAWPYINALDYAANYYAMIRPRGMAKVQLLPGLKDPLITHKLTEEDWQNLETGRNRLTQLMFAMGAQHIFPSITGHPGWMHPAQVESTPLPRDKTQLMTIHMFSSCPMGENSARTAANSFGHVHGLKNLIIADASLLPDAPGVNPQASIMALAMRTAAHYLEKTS